MPKGLSRRASRTSAAHPCKYENSATQQIRRREPGSLGSCNPVKVTLPELLIEGVILLTQAGELDLHICAVTCGGERDLNECRCRRRCVGSLTVPSDHKAVRGIDFDVAVGDYVPSRSRVERVLRPGSRHEISPA